MKVIADFCIVPLDVGTSLSPYVAACQRVIEEAGLSHTMHAYGTNVEGDWDDVLRALRDCHRAVHEMGAPRVTSTVKLGTRTDRDQTMAEKVASVARQLPGPASGVGAPVGPGAPPAKSPSPAAPPIPDPPATPPSIPDQPPAPQNG